MPPLSSTLRVRGDAAAATSEPRNLKCVLGPVNDPQKTGRPAPAHRSPPPRAGRDGGPLGDPGPRQPMQFLTANPPKTRPETHKPRHFNPSASAGAGGCHLAGRSPQASCLPLDWLHLTPARGGPVPSRRTLAPGILPSARSMLASLSPSWLRLASTRRLDWHRPTPREPVVRGPAVFPRWPAPPPPCPTDTPRRFRPGRGRI